jgi:hypothetical protein
MRGEIYIGRGRIHPVNGRIFEKQCYTGSECNDGRFPGRKAPRWVGSGPSRTGVSYRYVRNLPLIQEVPASTLVSIPGCRQ